MSESVAGNPIRHDNGNAYDRLAFMARLVTGYAAVVTVAFVALAGFTISLFPLKEIRPQFVMWSDKREQVVTVEAGTVSRETRDIIAEKLLRQYVLARETINHVDEADRYTFVARLSARPVFEFFEGYMNPSKSTSPLRAFAAAKMTRETHVTDVYPTIYGDGIYSVEYTAIDRRAHEEVGRAHWVATVQVEYQALRTKNEFVTDNPIGLTVTGFEIRQREMSAPAALPLPSLRK